MYETVNRIHDPQLGIFRQIDPKAELDYGLSPFVAMRNNPAYFTDPFGDVAGVFLDGSGKTIGNDGIDDGKAYVLKTTETNFDSEVPANGITEAQLNTTTSFIKKNSGNSDEFKNNSIAYDNSVEMEGNIDNRKFIFDEMMKDNGKGGEKPTNNREYSVSIMNNGTPVANPPGEVKNPKTDATMDVGYTATGVRTNAHSHGSGTVDEVQRVYQGDKTIISTQNYGWRQAPSMEDLVNAGNKTFMVFGRGDGKVYFFNSKGVQATIPSKRFVDFKK